jgi:hypothetical protein
MDVPEMADREREGPEMADIERKGPGRVDRKSEAL